jgi:hypothetical protein
VDVGGMRGATEVLVTGDGLLAATAVVTVCVGMVAALDEREPTGAVVPELPEHAASAEAASAVTAHRAPGRPRLIRSACHAVPIRMRGCADGVSHRINPTSVVCGIATQPAVGAPSVTCRKNADPCGQAALPDGVSMTTA